MKTVSLCGMLLLLMNPVLMAENWPCFRGPSRQGISQEKNVPIHWDVTRNVAWKISIPGQGHSSPIVYDKRVYITTAVDEGASLLLLCIDTETGKVYWDKEVTRQKAGHKEKRNSYATPTPLTDGERIYVLAVDGTILALSMDGNELWRHQELEYYSQHGIAVSPILQNGLLIVPFDGSSSGPEPANRIRFPGRTPWALANTWAAPKVITPGNVQPGKGMANSRAPVATMIAWASSQSTPAGLWSASPIPSCR